MSKPTQAQPNFESFDDMHAETQLLHAGTLRSQFGEVSEAIYMNSGFCYDSAEIAESRFNGEAPGFVYSRYRNPSLAMLEERLRVLEGAAACVSLGSGMAAVFASMMSFLKTGDHVVANRVLFGSCHYIITEVLPRFGITYELVDGTDNVAWEAALKKPTNAVFIESPANPTLQLVDIAHVAALAHKHAGCQVIVDNIFATPLSQRPFDLGADIVIYSTTKYFDGQGRTLGGAILCKDVEFMEEYVLPFHRHTGPAMSTFNAWVLLKSLETLPMRWERHCENANKIASMLAEHPAIKTIHYPGLETWGQHALAKKQMKHFGAIIAFEFEGGKETAFAFMNALRVIKISNNLGDAKSLITHPASTTHSNIDEATRNEIGITNGIMRLSVGLENADDLLADITNACEVACGA